MQYFPPEIISISFFLLCLLISILMYFDSNLDQEIARFDFLVWIYFVGVLSYTLQLFNIGSIIPVRTSFPIMRYMDYLFSNPFAVMYIGVLSGTTGRKLLTPSFATFFAVGTALIIDILVNYGISIILSGILFLILIGFLVIVYYYLFNIFQNNTNELNVYRQLLFYRNLYHVGLLSIFSPLPFILSPELLGYLSQFTSETLLIYIDVIYKASMIIFVRNSTYLFE